MPVLAGGVSPIHPEILFTQPARPAIGPWPGGEGILLSRLPIHLAERSHEAFQDPGAHGPRLLSGGSDSTGRRGKHQDSRLIAMASRGELRVAKGGLLCPRECDILFLEID